MFIKSYCPSFIKYDESILLYREWTFKSPIGVIAVCYRYKVDCCFQYLLTGTLPFLLYPFK